MTKNLFNIHAQWCNLNTHQNRKYMQIASWNAIKINTKGAVFFYREYYLKLGNFHWLKELIASLLVWRKKMIKNQKQAYLFVVSNHVSTFCYWRTKMQLISQLNSGHLAVGTFQTVQNSIVFKKTSITSCNLQQWLLVRILQF